MLDKQISLEVLAEHKSDSSLWIAVHGSVYDVSAFGPDHPGGIDVLRETAGTDGTEMYEYAGHSADAMQKLQQYRIGLLSDSAAAKPAADRQQNPQQFARGSSQHYNSAVITAAFDVGVRMRRIIMLATGAIVATAMTYTIVRYASLSFVQHASFLVGLGSFWTGLGLALVMGSVGTAYGYFIFAKTLDYHSEVFAYPATIPRRRKS